MRLFEHDRHELLNELDKADVYECVSSFFKEFI